MKTRLLECPIALMQALAPIDRGPGALPNAFQGAMKYRYHLDKQLYLLR